MKLKIIDNNTIDNIHDITIEQLSTLNIKLNQEGQLNSRRFTVEETREQVRQWIDIIYALSEGQISWFIVWENIRWSREYFSRWVYVCPEFRRRGIARLLKKEQISFVGEKYNPESIACDIHKDNKASLKLSKQLWFYIWASKRWRDWLSWEYYF